MLVLDSDSCLMMGSSWVMAGGRVLVGGFKDGGNLIGPDRLWLRTDHKQAKVAGIPTV
jgi:hypothetical protein